MRANEKTMATNSLQSVWIIALLTLAFAPPLKKIADEREYERGGKHSERRVCEPSILIERANARRQAGAFQNRFDVRGGSQRCADPE
jgi:hypothetical protein